MSRVKRFTQSLASGYVLLGGNILFTFTSVPLALHYLSKKEFGLWALVMQVSGYLQLIDLGMSNSIARILIDHKDKPSEGIYGAVIKTGALVLLVQGAIIAVAGSVLSLWLPDLFAVPSVYRREFQILVAGQCIVTGCFFVGRIMSHLLQAHQRYDAWNYSQLGCLAVSFGVMWFGFAAGWGLYSMLAACVGANIFSTLFTLRVAARLKVFPAAAHWGRANWKMFHELFGYGRELFLLSVGWQLVNASQVMVISRTLGLETAAVWSIATKPFTMAQMAVNRLMDFSTAAFSEMVVRQERQQLLARFRDLMTLSTALAVWAGLAVALCNQSFLALWTQGRIAWSAPNDWLMALLVLMYSTTRWSQGLICTIKEIRALKYIYPLEGAAFIGLSVWLAPHWGLGGVILNALLMNILFSGVYGLWRIKNYFGIGSSEVLDWLRGPSLFLLALTVPFAGLAWLSSGWNPYLRLGVEAVFASVTGFALFWKIGLSQKLRTEFAGLWRKLLQRLRPQAAQVQEAPRVKV